MIPQQEQQPAPLKAERAPENRDINCAMSPGSISDLEPAIRVGLQSNQPLIFTNLNTMRAKALVKVLADIQKTMNDIPIKIASFTLSAERWRHGTEDCLKPYLQVGGPAQPPIN